MLHVSIVIPTYKRVDQTVKTIQSILNSKGLGSYFQLEIIISDGSPDNSVQERIQAEFKQNNTIVYTRPSKSGIAASKNHGASRASHPILIFSDSDIELQSETILRTLVALKKYPSAGAIGGNVIWKGGPPDGKKDRPRDEDRTYTHDDTIYIEALYSRYIATYTDVFSQVGGYDELIFNMRGEGADLSIRYWRAGYPLAYDPSIMVHHVHDVEGGIIRNRSEPELEIAKDLFLLAHKYDLHDSSYDNFNNTIAANFKEYGLAGYSKILRGLLKHYEFITQAKPILDSQKKEMNPEYKFHFLEVFSDQDLLMLCLSEAQERMRPFHNHLNSFMV